MRKGVTEVVEKKEHVKHVALNKVKDTLSPQTSNPRVCGLVEAEPTDETPDPPSKNGCESTRKNKEGKNHKTFFDILVVVKSEPLFHFSPVPLAPGPESKKGRNAKEIQEAGRANRAHCATLSQPARPF